MKRRPLLININTGGRLGNHLFCFAWLIEAARLTGGLAINPAFLSYKEQFAIPFQQKIPFWPEKARLHFSDRLACIFLNRQTLWTYHHFRIKYNRRMDEARELLKRIPIVGSRSGYIAFDWLVAGRKRTNNLPPTFATPDGKPDYFSERVTRYIESKDRVLLDSAPVMTAVPPSSAAEIRRYLKPHPRFLNPAFDWITHLRKDAEVVVGVAIRQGDFKYWAGGAGFVGPEFFVAVMKAFVAQIAPRRCIFALCSDEPLDPKYFPGLNTLSVLSGPENQFCIQQSCDFLIGTAKSTFIQWASFLGQVPWLPVSKTTDPLQLRIDSLRPFGEGIPVGPASIS